MKLWTKLRLLLLFHTYIIDHYNPSVRITAGLLTPLMLCALILYVSGGTYSLMSTPNDIFFFWEAFHGNFICSQSFCQQSAERKSPTKYFFPYFVLMSGLGFRSNKSTHYLRPNYVSILPSSKNCNVFQKTASGLFTAVHPLEVVGAISFSHFVR